MQDIKAPNPHPHAPVKPGFEAHAVGSHEIKAPEPAEKVKVKFAKFVQLVATHDFEEVMKNHANEDIILSTNLLTDLANAHEEPQTQINRMPIFVLAGAAIGIALTYILLKFL